MIICAEEAYVNKLNTTNRYCDTEWITKAHEEDESLRSLMINDEYSRLFRFIFQ